MYQGLIIKMLNFILQTVISPLFITITFILNIIIIPTIT